MPDSNPDSARRHHGGEPSVVRTRPRWITRAISVALTAHAFYLVSPWFVPPHSLAVRTDRSWGLYLETPIGRWILFFLELAFAVLMWKLSTRRSKSTGRWYAP
jgi:hypothetical protein